ncbi:zinc-dependent peptidase [Saprospiraceae bacterium]|jgi:Mlc titration factor MtfA (ptsG expression regulator)|nr:zinc-dependent peptidase [Bacteroidota bacterium]MDB4727408.1 zinc-dependent peptidase [Saprospiraceae bacterium]MDF1867366.1 zinc-dependent peptidase [Saprospiraceae bacterium]
MRELLLSYWYKKFPPQIPTHYHRTLNIYSAYYQYLNEENQVTFQKRLFILLKFIRFIPKGLPQVTDEMKVVIGSAIIQITFGLDHYLVKEFNTIYVVPRAYNFRDFKTPFLGHVDFTNKIVCFSWRDVKTGFFIADDAVNVALHEMAHCLEKENTFRQLFRTFFDSEKLAIWTERALEKMERIRRQENQFLKNYGGKNIHEMFAVCVEAFFEKPDEFRYYLPELFDSLRELLNQDPTIRQNPPLK